MMLVLASLSTLGLATGGAVFVTTGGYSFRGEFLDE